VFSALSFGDNPMSLLVSGRLIPLGRLGFLADSPRRARATSAPTCAGGDHGGAQAGADRLPAGAIGEANVKETEQQEAEKVRQRLVKQLRRRARELGFELTRKEPDTEATGLVEA
jgi:hypothetical protein